MLNNNFQQKSQDFYNLKESVHSWIIRKHLLGKYTEQFPSIIFFESTYGKSKVGGHGFQSQGLRVKTSLET